MNICQKTGKTGHAGRALASAEARKFPKRGDIYRCDYCQEWHVCHAGVSQNRRKKAGLR